MEESIRKEFSLAGQRPRSLSAHSLAYLGDAVYETVIRMVIVEQGDRSAKKMNRDAVELARASAQARLIRAIAPDLTEEEQDIFRRGRNTNPGMRARHATMSEYRLATGFETLVGYLYLKGEKERLLSLIHMGWDRINHET